VFGRLWEKLKLLWKLAKSERASPREIAWAVGLGAFAGCSPAIGFHGPLAIGLATLARKNRLFAWLGSRISNMLMLPFIALAEVQVAHRLRTGSFVELTTDNALELAPKLLLDWCLGMFPVGGAIGLVMGFSAYGLARRRDRLRERATALAATAEGAASDPPATTPPKPSGLPPPSSGSRA
jgi:uncharacterized protein (DUF2062 family)